MLNEAKNHLITEAKKIINSNAFEEKLVDKIWENLKYQKTIIEDSTINNNIKNYLKKKNLSSFKNDLCALCKGKINKINVKDTDPKNIYLQTFMKQNELYYETK